MPIDPAHLENAPMTAIANLLDHAADAIDPARYSFTPEEEGELLAAFRAGMAEISAEVRATDLESPRLVVRWLADAYRLYGAREAISRVACFLAVIDRKDEDVKIRRIVKGAHVSEDQVEKALDRLLADGFIDIRPTVRLKAKRIKLLR